MGVRLFAILAKYPEFEPADSGPSGPRRGPWQPNETHENGGLI